MAPPVSQTHVKGDVERLKDAIAATFSASDAEDLLKTQNEEVADNINATFPNFVVWLYLEHPSTAKLRVIPETLLKQLAERYDHAVDKHIADVEELIDGEISTTASGRALLKYIALAKHTRMTHLTIAARLGENEVIDAEEQNAKLYPNAFAVDTVVRDGGGKLNLTDPKPGQKAKALAGGGWGVDVEIFFSTRTLKKKWRASHDLPKLAEVNTPGLVLFHEMVHSSSMLHGRLTRERVFEKQDKGAQFDDEAEFLAIMIGNIFLSEEHKIDLRADHRDSIPKLLNPETFLDNYPHLNPSPRRILARFRLEQAGFYWTLKNIPADVAPFNPIRLYEEQLEKDRQFMDNIRGVPKFKFRLPGR